MCSAVSREHGAAGARAHVIERGRQLTLLQILQKMSRGELSQVPVVEPDAECVHEHGVKVPTLLVTAVSHGPIAQETIIIFGASPAH